MESYKCRQEITIIKDSETCDRVTSEKIAIEYILGVDCKWNSSKDSKISLIQVATRDDVFLFRITKMTDGQIPKSLRDILENPEIIKVGVYIENDVANLSKQYQCNMKGWMDLRNLIVTKEAYGRVVLEKLKKNEEKLATLPEDQKSTERFKWQPKLGLAALTEDCFGLRHPSSENAWKDDWEAEKLTKEQINYAAADAAAGLDIFCALLAEKVLGTPFSASEMEIVPDMKDQLTDFCGRWIEKNAYKDKGLKKECFKVIANLDEEFDLTEYKKKAK